MLPRDLILVLHGQSEGNAAKRLSEKGDHSGFALLQDRHTASLRLTAKGRDQAKRAGAFIRDHLMPEAGIVFDRFITSEYTRAMETAALLNIPNAKWFCDFYITERDSGELEICSDEERDTKFGDALQRRKVEPFFWRPPNGESFAQLCLRVDRVLHTLHRECSDKQVIIVCHGEVMWAFRVRLERISQPRFKELIFSENHLDRIYNCQILHYSRRHPEDLNLEKYMNWMRWIRPSETPAKVSGWQRINRPHYSNEELLEVVQQTPAMIE